MHSEKSYLVLIVVMYTPKSVIIMVVRTCVSLVDPLKDAGGFPIWQG